MRTTDKMEALEAIVATNGYYFEDWRFDIDIADEHFGEAGTDPEFDIADENEAKAMAMYMSDGPWWVAA